MTDSTLTDSTMTDSSAGSLRTVTPTGTTTVSPRVVEKIAARAAAEVPGAHEVAIRGLPALLAPLERSTPTADADLGRDSIHLVLHIEAEWPAPLAALARRARDEVRSTVHELTGLEVGAVDVSVEHFVGARPRPRPRVV